MQLSYVPIANMALNHLGENDRIVDPNDTGPAAAAVKRAWDLTRLFVLAEANWSFAVRTVDLVQRAPNPDWPIALERQAFPLPADLVSFIEIVEPNFLDDEPDRYSIESGPNGAEILTCFDGPITVRYVRDGADVADPARWLPAFAQVFTWRLAWQISDALGAEKARKDRVLSAGDRALKLARKSNAHFKARRRNHTGDWIAARFRGWQGRAPGVAY